MKYICLFLKSLTCSLSPMPGLKFQNQQNPCEARKLYSVYPHSKENISSSISSQLPCTAAQKLLMRTPLMNGNIIQFSNLLNVQRFLLYYLYYYTFQKETTQLVLRGLKWRSSFNKNNPKLFFQINEIKALTIHTDILLWPLHGKQVSNTCCWNNYARLDCGVFLKDNIFEKLKISQRPLLFFNIHLFQSSFQKSTKHSNKRKLNLFESVWVINLCKTRKDCLIKQSECFYMTNYPISSGLSHIVLPSLYLTDTMHLAKASLDDGPPPEGQLRYLFRHSTHMQKIMDTKGVQTQTQR